MDFGDLIVHIFDRENRRLYDLERIWRDGRQMEMIFSRVLIFCLPVVWLRIAFRISGLLTPYF